MAAEPVFFRDLAYVLIAAVLGGALAWLARQPLVVGYVVGGMVISPLTPGPSIADSRHFEVFAEIAPVFYIAPAMFLAMEGGLGVRGYF